MTDAGSEAASWSPSVNAITHAGPDDALFNDFDLLIDFRVAYLFRFVDS
jgi:hypothetical protein